jgi:hypothetical protein
MSNDENWADFGGASSTTADEDSWADFSSFGTSQPVDFGATNVISQDSSTPTIVGDGTTAEAASQQITLHSEQRKVCALDLPSQTRRIHH